MLRERINGKSEGQLVGVNENHKAEVLQH